MTWKLSIPRDIITFLLVGSSKITELLLSDKYGAIHHRLTNTPVNEFYTIKNLRELGVDTRWRSEKEREPDKNILMKRIRENRDLYYTGWRHGI